MSVWGGIGEWVWGWGLQFACLCGVLVAAVHAQADSIAPVDDLIGGLSAGRLAAAAL